MLRVTETMWAVDDYSNRDGYRPDFISGFEQLPLPHTGDWENDLVELVPEARRPGELSHIIPYRHFSVIMSQSRSLPLVSAVNIDGRQMKRGLERTDIWRRDPRIPRTVQNLRTGYGHDHLGFFARGHMTRREDPNWGTLEEAKEADADTFHITNVAPQRQGFNAGIWLDLESYVLDNCDDANLKISVLTGPVLTDDDPVYYERKMPVEFWKIVAFVHARTRELTTIGYRRSQVESLPSLRRNRFVFGDFDDCQVPISSISRDTGLDFGVISELDVMAGADDRMEVRVKSVSDFFLQR